MRLGIFLVQFCGAHCFIVDFYVSHLIRAYKIYGAHRWNLQFTILKFAFSLLVYLFPSIYILPSPNYSFVQGFKYQTSRMYPIGVFISDSGY